MMLSRSSPSWSFFSTAHHVIKLWVVYETIFVHVSLLDDVSYLLFGDVLPHEAQHNGQFLPINIPVTVLYTIWVESYCISKGWTNTYKLDTCPISFTSIQKNCPRMTRKKILESCLESQFLYLFKIKSPNKLH